jgi:hypothetical protein
MLTGVIRGEEYDERGEYIVGLSLDGGRLRASEYEPLLFESVAPARLRNGGRNAARSAVELPRSSPAGSVGGTEAGGESEPEAVAGRPDRIGLREVSKGLPGSSEDARCGGGTGFDWVWQRGRCARS